MCRAQIHWFSIINSCVTVLLLTGFLATILMRVLKNDFLKYSRDDDGALRPVHAASSCLRSTAKKMVCVRGVGRGYHQNTGVGGSSLRAKNLPSESRWCNHTICFLWSTVPAREQRGRLARMSCHAS